MGIRDLRAPHAMESAAPPPPRAARADGQARARRRHGSRGIYAGAPLAQRRPCRRWYRRAQDRAAARGAVGDHAFGYAHRFRAHPRQHALARAARESRDGGLRRRRGIRHHGALGQELPQADPTITRAPRAFRAARRRALRRHAGRRGRFQAGLRSHRALRGRGQADSARSPQRSCQRRAHGVGFSHGAAAYRRRAARLGR